MHELRCGDIRDSDGSPQLHGLRCRHVLDVSRCHGIIDMRRLLCWYVCCDHGIDDMHFMRHGHLLSDEYWRMHELQCGGIRDSLGIHELHELQSRNILNSCRRDCFVDLFKL